MASAPPPWQPKTILRPILALPTATATVLVETDQGEGYLKAMGNPESPHVLACEWVGTQLARRLGLLTFDFALVQVTVDDEIPFARGGKAQPGPAFITRRERGVSWGGKRSLKKVANPQDITRLVLFDTWTRNCDRHPPDPTQRRPNRDNVFLSREGAPRRKLLLKVMDQGCCFNWGRDLTARLAELSFVREEGVYGLFPEFWEYLDREALRDAVRTLRGVKQEEVRRIVDGIPTEWDVPRAARDALVEFISRRAAFVCEHIEGCIWPQREFDFSAPEGETP
jgi:hypothetical protein